MSKPNRTKPITCVTGTMCATIKPQPPLAVFEAWAGESLISRKLTGLFIDWERKRLARTNKEANALASPLTKPIRVRVTVEEI